MFKKMLKEIFTRKATKLEFRSACEGGSTCVEVAFAIEVRDSNRPWRRPLQFTESEWRDFVAGVKLGEFNLG
jgi:hypothetical protein